MGAPRALKARWETLWRPLYQGHVHAERQHCPRIEWAASESRGCEATSSRRCSAGEPMAWRGVGAVSFPEPLCMTVPEQIPQLGVVRGDQSRA